MWAWKYQLTNKECRAVYKKRKEREYCADRDVQSHY